MWDNNLKEQTEAWAEITRRCKAVSDPDLKSFQVKMAPVIDNFVKKTGAKGKAYVDGVLAAA